MLGWILSAVGIGGVVAAAIMFPPFGMLLTRILGGILEIAKKIPWYIWVAIAAALIGWRLVVWHNHTVEQAYVDGDKAGYSRAMEEVRVKAEEVRAKAEAARRKAEAAAVDINKELRDAREHEAAAIRDRANAVRMRWNAEAKNRAGRGSANLPGIPGSTAAQPTGGAVDAGVVTLPREPLLGFGESHDQCLADRSTWEVWYERQKTLNDNWQPPPETSSSTDDR